MKKSSGSRSRKQRLTAVGTRCADRVTPLYPQKLALASPTGDGRSVGIVRVRTKATEFSSDTDLRVHIVHVLPTATCKEANRRLASVPTRLCTNLCTGQS